MKITKKVVIATLLGASALAHADGIEWSGFGSLYYSQAFDNQMLQSGSSNNKMDFTSKSLLGFNVGSKITDDMSVASQIVMSGSGAQSTNFNMFAQWAYLNYKVMDGLNFKIGRQLWPVQISSEYQRVHQLLPQSNIPYTAYGILPFVGFDGASLNKTLDVGIGTLTVGAYAGNPKLNTTPPPALTLDFQSLMGARVTLDGSGWRLHATYNRVYSKVTVDTVSYQNNTSGSPLRTYGQAGTHSDIFSFGYRFDKSNFVSWGEVAYSKGKDNSLLTLKTYTASNVLAATSSKTLFEKSYGGYLLFGYRVGKFLPSVSYARGTAFLGLPSSSVTSSPLSTAYEGKTESYILSTSYAVNDQATARIEYVQTWVPRSASGPWYDVSKVSGYSARHTDAVKAGIDFIF